MGKKIISFQSGQPSHSESNSLYQQLLNQMHDLRQVISEQEKRLTDQSDAIGKLTLKNEELALTQSTHANTTKQTQHEQATALDSHVKDTTKRLESLEASTKKQFDALVAENAKLKEAVERRLEPSWSTGWVKLDTFKVWNGTFNETSFDHGLGKLPFLVNLQVKVKDGPVYTVANGQHHQFLGPGNPGAFTLFFDDKRVGFYGNPWVITRSLRYLPGNGPQKQGLLHYTGGPPLPGGLESYRLSAWV